MICSADVTKIYIPAIRKSLSGARAAGSTLDLVHNWIYPMIWQPPRRAILTALATLALGAPLTAKATSCAVRKPPAPAWSVTRLRRGGT
jgi:hypothetical protein